jgi:hypothetical protein
MPTFQCQMLNVDGDGDWEEVKAYDAQMAAMEYAKRCESHSGGEMLNTEDDHETVRVMDAKGITLTFSIRAYYSKNFIAHVTRPTTQQTAPEK